MIAQDVTGSFTDDLHDARAAVLGFLEAMIDAPLPGDRIGMSTFVGGVDPTPWTPLTELAGREQALRDQWATLAPCNCTEPYTREECASNELGWNVQPWMIDCDAHGTGTAFGPALRQTVLQLRDHDRAYRAIVLVTDGMPCCGDQTVPRVEDATGAADFAWANKIHVWVVGYAKDAVARQDFLERFTRGHGTAVVTTDPDELPELLLGVAQQIDSRANRRKTSR